MNREISIRPLGARTLLGARGIASRSKDATNGAPGLTTRNKMLLGFCCCFLLFCEISIRLQGALRGADGGGLTTGHHYQCLWHCSQWRLELLEAAGAAGTGVRQGGYGQKFLSEIVEIGWFLDP